MTKLSDYLRDKLARLDWLNLGGGYLFHQIANQQPFIDLVTQLKSRFNLEVYIEPGNAIVKSAGYLVASVIDVFVSDGKPIVILDTSVNHNPEVFEYTVQPELHEHNAKGRHAVILAGGTCLAGDIFGEYRFHEPLTIGDKVVFKNVGAYSLVKASRFNGQNLPSVYMHRSGRLKLVKQFGYEDFRRAWWAD
jgi:carboxynorspermidine decarboxylase